jgi:aspartate kinase
MKVFKFGGASVKDADAVKNVASILDSFANENLVVVISAMDKTTNALEKVVRTYWNKGQDLRKNIDFVKDFHVKIATDLGFKSDHEIFQIIHNAFVELDWILEEEPSKDYGFIYDQVVSHGELLSTKIISVYLNENGLKNHWLDARDVLITDNSYRDAKVNWGLTEKLITKRVNELRKNHSVIITQGFIGATSENFTTTLGREGSDYTAAIFSYSLNADEMCVWKDVPGVLSADPKYYPDAVKLDEISYLDAIELTYYGASVIHPKTIKPLENKQIPLRVRSFTKPKEEGTRIGNYSETKPLVPSFIFKSNQILLSISATDFSFIAEDHLSKIFKAFAEHKVKMNLSQNSAISFSACSDNDEFKMPGLVEELKKDFKVLYNDKLRLVTVRHYNEDTIDSLTKDKTILIEQRSRNTAQVILKED